MSSEILKLSAQYFYHFEASLDLKNIGGLETLGKFSNKNFAGKQIYNLIKKLG